jgi:2,5-dihydroxypyridine 5,6-dioxygenase
MYGSELFAKARVAIEYYLEVKKGDTVLIADDQTLTSNTVNAFRFAAEAAGATAIVVSYRNPRFIPLKEYCHMTRLLANPSRQQEEDLFSKPFVEAVRRADAVVMASSDLEFLFSKTIEDILSDGVRIIALPYLTEEGIARMFPSDAAEAQSLKETVERVTHIFEKSRTARVVSDAGTNLTANIGQYPILPHLGVARKGEWTILPAGQVTNIPNDNSAEGTLVIDRTIAANDYKEINEPIKFTIKSGDVVKIEGGVEAEKLRRFMEKLNDKHMYHLTELAVGVNPRCKFSGIGAPTEDTHALGCVSLALGCDLHLGGRNPGPAHIDMTMRYPSLTLDETRTIVEAGVLKA